MTEGGGAITWQTQTFAENVNANALRWATLYNFRFDADAPPTEVTATLGLFVPMAPMEVEFPLLAPAGVATSCAADIDESGEVGFADLLLLLAVWSSDSAAADLDGSGAVGFEDLLLLLAAWGTCL